MMKTRGFSLSECLVLVVVVGLIGAILVPMLGDVRKKNMGLTSAEKLMTIGQGGAMYGLDNADRLFSYTWRAGETYFWPDGRAKIASTDQEAASNQNVEILQRRTGLITGILKIQNFSTRLPHRRYSHLVLGDYLNLAPNVEDFIDPSDGKQLAWSSRPLDWRTDMSLPYSGGSAAPGYDQDVNWSLNTQRQRWAYSSSYHVVPDAWQPDSSPRYIPVESTPHLFQSNGAQLSLADGRRFSSVLHHANKVWMYEEFDRDRTQHLYFGYDDAAVEKLMFDGSVNNWESGRAAPSVVPERGMFHWQQAYVPLDKFPVPVGGLGDTTEISQRFRWTYGGLSGINYGAFSFK
jgi:hypothetical protein